MAALNPFTVTTVPDPVVGGVYKYRGTWYEFLGKNPPGRFTQIYLSFKVLGPSVTWNQALARECVRGGASRRVDKYAACLGADGAICCVEARQCDGVLKRQEWVRDAVGAAPLATGLGATGFKGFGVGVRGWPEHLGNAAWQVLAVRDAGSVPNALVLVVCNVRKCVDESVFKRRKTVAANSAIRAAKRKWLGEKVGFVEKRSMCRAVGSVCCEEWTTVCLQWQCTGDEDGARRARECLAGVCTDWPVIAHARHGNTVAWAVGTKLATQSGRRAVDAKILLTKDGGGGLAAKVAEAARRDGERRDARAAWVVCARDKLWQARGLVLIGGAGQRFAQAARPVRGLHAPARRQTL